MEAALQDGDGPTTREGHFGRESDPLRDALTRRLMQVEMLRQPVFASVGDIAIRGPSPRGDRVAASRARPRAPLAAQPQSR
jgi:hypothetical protein